MKKLILVVFVLFFVCAVSYAQEAMEPVCDSAQITGIMSFSGKIASVEDLSAGNVQINLLGQDRATMDFRAAAGTQITGLEGNPLTVDQLRKDMDVIVEYVSSPGGESKVISVQQTKFYEVDADN